jgi:hypothetical protein
MSLTHSEIEQHYHSMCTSRVHNTVLAGLLVKEEGVGNQTGLLVCLLFVSVSLPKSC